jgi:hypothetical protein
VQQRAPGFRIMAGAYASWERQSLMPGDLDTVVRRIMALSATPFTFAAWSPMPTCVSSRPFSTAGLFASGCRVDRQGRWMRVREVQSQGSA